MLVNSLLASVRARLFGSDRRSVRPRRRTKAVRSVLNLEALEDRLVPTGATVFLNNGIVSIQDSTSNANAVVSTTQAGHVQVKLSGDTFAQSGPSGITGYGTNMLDIDPSLSGFGKYGFSMSMNGTISLASGTSLTTAGSLSLTGMAYTTTNNVGVSINGASLNASTISLTGNQYADSSSSLASNNNDGVLIWGSHLTAGSVNITGDGEGVGSNEDGVVIGGASKVTATGTGGITIHGYGSWGGQNSNVGVYITDQGTLLSTGTGTLNISGNGGGHGSYNYGLDVQNGAQLTTQGGVLELSGSAFNQSTGSANDGVTIAGGSRVTTTGGGTLTVVGTASPNGQNANIGVNLTDSGTLLSTQTGTLSVQGTGGGSGANNYGIGVQSGAALQSSGAVTLTGAASTNGAGAMNDGIYMSAAVVNAGSVSLIGTGGGSGADETGIELLASSVTAQNSVVFQASAGGTDGFGLILENSKVQSSGGTVQLIGTGLGTFDGGGIIIANTPVLGDLGVTIKGRGTAVGVSIKGPAPSSPLGQVSIQSSSVDKNGW